MQFDVRSNVMQVKRFLDEAQQKQLPFATVLAMTLTAKDVKEHEKTVMQRVFDRPTPYALNALQVKPATKRTMQATVEFKEGFNGTPAKRFLNPEVNGGPRSQKSSEKSLASRLKTASYYAPGRAMALNSYGNLSGSAVKKILSQLGASSNADSNATNSKRSKRKRKTQAFFIPKKGGMVLERKGEALSVALVGIRSPHYRKRFPFYEEAAKVVEDRMPVNFEVAFQKAMATARAPR